MAIRWLAAWIWMVGAVAAPASAERVGIAVVVNDDIITTTDVADRRALIMATSGIPDTPENIKKITPRIIDSLIDETVQMQDAKRQSLTATPEEVEKAIGDLTAGRGQPAGSLKALLQAKGLSTRSLENQIRAQLLWNKVVQRKLRRNVSISSDEVLRAQQAQSAAPGVTELKIAVLAVPIVPEKTAAGEALAESIAGEFKTGADMTSVVARYLGKPEVQFSPPSWVAEENLQPALQQALRTLKAGDISPPLRSTSAVQFLQLLDKRTTKKQVDSTEIAIKQIVIDLPAQRDKTGLAKLKETSAMLRSNPGSCDDELLPKTSLPAEAKLARTKIGMLNPEQRAIIAPLEVGAVSEAIMTPSSLRLVALCEKIEASAGNLPPADEVRQQLFADKMELEAQKHLRNLRRDAFIDIKGDS